MWPACAIEASGGRRSTGKRLWLGSSRGEKRHFRMGDSWASANRRGLQVHRAQLMIRCHSAANSAWSPGRVGAWIVQGMHNFGSLLDSFVSSCYGAEAGVYSVMWLQ